jgi:hypothetical protein
MAYEVTPEEAATRLDTTLRGRPWYLSTGVGEAAHGTVLFIYTTKVSRKEIAPFSQGWMGYPVMIRTVGNIRLAATY